MSRLQQASGSECNINKTDEWELRHSDGFRAGTHDTQAHVLNDSVNLTTMFEIRGLLALVTF